MEKYVIDQLINIVGAGNTILEAPMSLHTTFRTGGPAEMLITPQGEADFVEAVRYCKAQGIPYLVIGNGSNLLVSDEGIRGVVFRLYKTMDDVTFEVCDEDTVEVVAGAGIMLSKLAKLVADEGLEGFEYASGIPGTFGGAVTMNAGAYGGEIVQNIVGARVMDTQGNVKILEKDALELGYRSSVIQKMDYVVLEARMRFKRGDQKAIYDKINQLTQQRKEKQPLEYPSAGSTFKRPEGYFAGKLIQDCGLKGYRVGGVCVSEKHSGFVVNDQGGTSADVWQLIQDVQAKVYETFGVMLEPEVRIIGRF